MDPAASILALESGESARRLRTHGTGQCTSTYQEAPCRALTSCPTQPAGPAPKWHMIAAMLRGPYTPPVPEHRIVIRKPSKGRK
jgi:hypothetical protein